MATLRTYLFIVLALVVTVSFGQQQEKFIVLKDTNQIDTLSILPGSVMVTLKNGSRLNEKRYTVDAVNSLLIIHDQTLVNKRVKVKYNTLAIDLGRDYYHKSTDMIRTAQAGVFNPFKFQLKPRESDDVFNFGEVNKSGSISRGISFGNSQNLSVNSNLNLQLSGRITDQIRVMASVTDNNIPIQPDGNTQQLQDFDQVYIKLYDDHSRLLAGDFQLRNWDNRFLRFYKRAQGASVYTKQLVGKDSTLTVTSRLSGAISKGKFSRNIITGVEGNQGPYRLKGNENETFIIVLSGTERVYLDGKKLKRGQNYDYTIDYNRAEITFTASQIITQYSRIIVEFQYSDKNYARSLIYTGHKLEGQKWEAGIQFYSESDAKNQPLQLDLSDAQKRILRSVGDSINDAYASTLDSTDFSTDFVMYKLVDTTVSGVYYDSILVYSINPDSAYYRASFAQVGTNNGNYVQINSLANGKVYQWVAPVAGVPQGNYEPVTLLPSPKKRQMLVLKTAYKFDRNHKVRVEGALSQMDPNNFSKKNDADNVGGAFNTAYEGLVKLSGDSAGKWFLKPQMNVEFISNRFRMIERFRDVEFYRDWNTRGVNFTGDQLVTGVGLSLIKSKKLLINYTGDYFEAGSSFTGIRHSGKLNFTSTFFDFQGRSTMLTSEGTNLPSTDMLKYYLEGSNKIGNMVTGLFYQSEENSLQLDSTLGLINNSFNFNAYGGFIRTKDTLKNPVLLKYTQRKDRAPYQNELKPSTLAHNVDFSADFNSNPANRLRVKSTYRQLGILDTLVAVKAPENTIVGRIDHSMKIKKGVISAITYYEVGSGLELKKEFSFIEVNPGQGTHQWIDYNNNGIKELNEFEIAAFQDQAKYIKVYTPTSDYVKTYTNQFSEVLFLKPEILWGRKKGILKTISRLSTKTAFRTDRKTNNRDEYYNPFLSALQDSALVSMNKSFQNTVYLNRISPVFGMQWVHQEIENKSLLVNGYESRSNIFNTLRVRWNASKKLTLKSSYKTGTRSTRSQFFTSRNYKYSYEEVKPEVQFQPGVKFRATVTYSYKQKVNFPEFGNEKTFINDLGGEMRLNVVGKGTVMAGVNIIDIKYNGNPGSSLGFEMLEGLQPGQNYTWRVGIQRSLNDHLQLTLNYNGRASENASVVHVGGVQLRAFF